MQRWFSWEAGLSFVSPAGAGGGCDARIIPESVHLSHWVFAYPADKLRSIRHRGEKLGEAGVALIPLHNNSGLLTQRREGAEHVKTGSG
jgi:hypothetical protein